MVDCNACERLCETSPDFVQYGVTDEICESLRNDTGLNPNLTVLHDNCEDFEDMNDCMIGRMAEDVELYEVCEWQSFMKRFIGNLYNFVKALNCSICGLWSYIKRILESMGGNLDEIPVYRVYHHTVRAERFIALSEPGVKPVNYFSGIGETWEGDVFSVPVEEMDEILGVFCQPQVVGWKSNPQTVAVQAWEKQGDKLIVDIDAYELIYGDYEPYDLPVDVLVVGKKKL